MNQLQDIVGEVRPAKQLVRRAAQHEGEIGRLLCQRRSCVRMILRGGDHDISGDMGRPTATSMPTRTARRGDDLPKAQAALKGCTRVFDLRPRDGIL